MVVATEVNVVGADALAAVGLLVATHGAFILTDWAGWGRRSYLRAARLMGDGFPYRYGSYRVVIGGGYLLMGLVFFALAIWLLLQA